jgi:hypothetical protein
VRTFAGLSYDNVPKELERTINSSPDPQTDELN